MACIGRDPGIRCARIANVIDLYSFGERMPGAVYGEDGAIQIFLQAEEPTDPAERPNWLSAPEGASIWSRGTTRPAARSSQATGCRRRSRHVELVAADVPQHSP
jgi:hypothetical protein